MADKHEAVDQENVEEDAFLNNDDVLVELGDDGDFPMDEELGDGEFIIEEGGGLDGEEGEDTVYEDNSIQHFPEHEKSVFAVSMHPTQPIAASGGEDDLGYLWNVENGETLVKLTGHTDSVIAVAFSSDGELVSTGGMDGKVRVWRRVGKENWSTWEFLTEVQGPDEVLVSNYITYLSKNTELTKTLTICSG